MQVVHHHHHVAATKIEYKSTVVFVQTAKQFVCACVCVCLSQIKVWQNILMRITVYNSLSYLT